MRETLEASLALPSYAASRDEGALHLGTSIARATFSANV